MKIILILSMLFISATTISDTRHFIEVKEKIDTYTLNLDSAISFLKYYEKYAEKPYLDTDGSWTIGYGHHIGKEWINRLSEEQADSLLRADLRHFEGLVDTLYQIKGNKRLAIALFTFNCGFKKFHKSHLLKLIKSNKSIDEEIVKWCHFTDVNNITKKDTNLLNRRIFESKIYNNILF